MEPRLIWEKNTGKRKKSNLDERRDTAGKETAAKGNSAKEKRNG